MHFKMFSHSSASLLRDSKEKMLPENRVEAYPEETRVSWSLRIEGKNKLGHLSILLYCYLEKN